MSIVCFAYIGGQGEVSEINNKKKVEKFNLMSRVAFVLDRRQSFLGAYVCMHLLCSCLSTS